MGRGLGGHQQAILDWLADGEVLTVKTLAAVTDRGERQTRAAVKALEARGLVEVERNECIGWTHGVGRWAYSKSKPSEADDPHRTAVFLESDGPLPEGLATYEGERLWWRRSIWVYRVGVPQHGSLVMLTEVAVRREQQRAERDARIAKILGLTRYEP